MLNDGLIYAMLISHEMFSSFTHKPISDNSTTQVLSAIEVESKIQVDEITHNALKNGAKQYRESVNHGWMYYDGFEDLDGH